MEVRQVYFTGTYDEYPKDPRFERAVFDPPHTGWGRVLVIPAAEGRSILIDPSSLYSCEVDNDCEELTTSKDAEGLSRTIARLKKNLVERDKLRLNIPRLGVDALLAAGVELPDVVLPEPEPAKEQPKRESKRPSREGLVSVSDIAKEMKLSPKEARAALRRAKTDKPDVGWAFPPSEVDKIKKAIKENLK